MNFFQTVVSCLSFQVDKYWAEKGISGFTVFKFRLKRMEGQPSLLTEQVIALAHINLWTKLFIFVLELWDHAISLYIDCWCHLSIFKPFVYELSGTFCSRAYTKRSF